MILGFISWNENYFLRNLEYSVNILERQTQKKLSEKRNWQGHWNLDWKTLVYCIFIENKTVFVLKADFIGLGEYNCEILDLYSKKINILSYLTLNVDLAQLWFSAWKDFIWLNLKIEVWHQFWYNAYKSKTRD